jgi:hypothetical protein
VLLSPSQVQTFPLAPCGRTRSVSDPPLI